MWIECNMFPFYAQRYVWGKNLGREYGFWSDDARICSFHGCMLIYPARAERKIIFAGAEACRRIPSRGLNFHTPLMEFALDGTRNLKLHCALLTEHRIYDTLHVHAPHAKFIECASRRVYRFVGGRVMAKLHMYIPRGQRPNSILTLIWAYKG
jgi:hypothetical protein